MALPAPLLGLLLAGASGPALSAQEGPSCESAPAEQCLAEVPAPPLRERLICTGNPLLDDPSCYAPDPAAAPRGPGPERGPERPLAAGSTHSLAGPGAATLDHGPARLLTEQPGHGLGLERPPAP